MEAPRRISVGRRITLRGIDERGELVTEEVLLTDTPVFTRTRFRYVGPYWWCRWHQLRGWLHYQLVVRWR